MWKRPQIGDQLYDFVKSGNVSEAFKAAAATADLPGLVANLTLNASSWAPPRSFSYTPTPPTPAPTPAGGLDLTTNSADADSNGKHKRTQIANQITAYRRSDGGGVLRGTYSSGLHGEAQEPAQASGDAVPFQ